MEGEASSVCFVANSRRVVAIIIFHKFSDTRGKQDVGVGGNMRRGGRAFPRFILGCRVVDEQHGKQRCSDFEL